MLHRLARLAALTRRKAKRLAALVIFAAGGGVIVVANVMAFAESCVLGPQPVTDRPQFAAHAQPFAVLARARAALEWRADPPEVLASPAEGLHLVGARHPLLLGQGVEVVPYDLALGADDRTLVVTVDVPALVGPEGSGGFSVSLGPIKFSSGDTATVDIVVHVPHGADVEVKTRSGDITVSGTTGTTRVATGSGDLRVQESGSLKASSGSGDITVGTCTEGSVNTGSGDVRVDRATGPGTLQLRSGSGDLEVRTGTEETTVATGSGDVDLDLRAGRATVRTGTGDVQVQVPREIPVWLDLHTAMGDVTQRIDPVGPPEGDQDHLSLSVRSGTGDIVISH